MLCDQLSTVVPMQLLACGSYIVEPKVRPQCRIGNEYLDLMHCGKDTCINQLMCGGQGYPFSPYTTDYAVNAFELGAAQERRDLKVAMGARA
jgi:hypothetical protein